jgi:hypothetical protein
MKYRADIDAHPVETKKSPFPYISLRRGKAACAKLARMKKRRIKIRPLPPELASAAKRKLLFASLLREGDTPYPFSQNNACAMRKASAAKDLGGKSADGQGSRHTNPTLPARQPKRGAPKGNRNALRHGGFTAKRLAARAQVRRIVADVDLAIALAFCASKGER